MSIRHDTTTSTSPDEPFDPKQLAELDEDGLMGRQVRERLTGRQGGTR